MDGKNMFARVAAERAEQQREIEAKVTGRATVRKDRPAAQPKDAKAAGKKPDPDAQATILITLSAAEKAKLKVEAAKLGTSASAIVREWIAQL